MLLSRSIVKLTTRGVIDRGRAVIYEERFVEQSDGTVICFVSGFYKLPWKVDSPWPTDESQSVHSIASAPIPKGKGMPDWYLMPPNDPTYIYATSVSPPGHPLAVAERIAMNMAFAELSRQIESRVSSLVKEYREGTGTGETILSSLTSASKVVAKQILSNASIVSRFVDTEVQVYVLVRVMKKPSVEEAFEALAKQTLEALQREVEVENR